MKTEDGLERMREAGRKSGRANHPNQRIVAGLLKIKALGQEQFTASEVSGFTRIPALVIGQKLKCTTGVAKVDKPYMWEFTGEPLAVQTS